MSNNGPGVTNPMLYDPPEGQSSNSKLMQFVAGVGVSIAAISAGTALGWTSPVLPQLALPEAGNDSVAVPASANNTDGDSGFYLTADQGSWVGAFLAVGAFCGALPAGYLAEKIGRKYTTMSLALPYLVSWALIIFASGAEMLYAGRFVIGIATGASCVVAPMFISEIAETSIRGALGAFFQLFLTVGILFVYAVGPYTSWTTLSVLCAAFPVLLILAMLVIPESPTYGFFSVLTVPATWGVSLLCRFLSRPAVYRRNMHAFHHLFAASSLSTRPARLIPPLETPLAVQRDRDAGWGPSEALDVLVVDDEVSV